MSRARIAESIVGYSSKTCLSLKSYKNRTVTVSSYRSRGTMGNFNGSPEVLTDGAYNRNIDKRLARNMVWLRETNFCTVLVQIFEGRIFCCFRG